VTHIETDRTKKEKSFIKPQKMVHWGFGIQKICRPSTNCLQAQIMPNGTVAFPHFFHHWLWPPVVAIWAMDAKLGWAKWLGLKLAKYFDSFGIFDNENWSNNSEAMNPIFALPFFYINNKSLGKG
jgi:hypothetical protein